MQRIATDLRPVILDSLGLAAAVEWQAEEFARRNGLACRAIVPEAELVVDRDRATALFRILQESLTNVVRHAEASAVEVRLAETIERVTLEVMDDGKGISPEELADPKSIGLTGMRERALAFGGTLVIALAGARGTLITASLPKDSSRTIPS